MKNINEKTSSSPPLGITILLVIVLGLWILSFLIITAIYGTPENPGVLGDMFGVINALFSGLALAFVIYAIFLQREDLKIQSEELQLSRKELSKQNKLIGEQLEAMQGTLENSTHKRR